MKYLIGLLFLSQLVFCQNDLNKIDSNGKKQGEWKGYFEESKRLRYSGTFINGIETGIFKFYDDTKASTVIATRDFTANDNSCYTIFYNQKSNKVSEGRQLKKLFEGKWIYYHEDSSVIMTNEFYKSGKLDGLRYVFYPNGILAEETNYKQGVKDGFYKKYTEKGIVLESSNYKNGEIDGLVTFKDPDDIIVAEGLYKNGKKIGIWKFYENGKLKSQQNFNFQEKKFKKSKRQ